MDYLIQQASLPGIGSGEKVFVDGRWVGFIQPKRTAVDQMAEPITWWAYIGGVNARVVASRDDGIARILEFADANPDVEMR